MLQVLLTVVDGLTTTTVITTPSTTPNNNKCAVVIGKIIIDEYKDPSTTTTKKDDEPPPVISVGGGGPQAAFGAAAALAVIDYNLQQQFKESTGNNKYNNDDNNDTTTIPPKQPVLFLGPIGNMSPEEKSSLYEMLGSYVELIELIEAPELQTPKIQLWHDSNEDLIWFPLEDSWGINGADSLWKNRPSSKDVLHAVQKQQQHNQQQLLLDNEDDDNTDTDTTSDDNKKMIDSIFLIMETSKDSPGNGEDSRLLDNEFIRKITNIIGIEPIAFPSDETTTTGNKIPSSDVIEFQNRLDKLQPIDIITPDKYLFESIQSKFWNNYTVAARYGDEGSRIIVSSNNNNDTTESNTTKEKKKKEQLQQQNFTNIPIATLRTPSGQVVNPTGAGNAYSSAFVTCLGQNLSVVESACIATAVGAAVCEYPNLPPWTHRTIRRIYDGSKEVQNKIIDKL